MIVIIGKMDNSVENLRPIQLTTGSLIDAYQNESVLWDTTKNSSEEGKELAWKRLSELFDTKKAITSPDRTGSKVY